MKVRYLVPLSSFARTPLALPPLYLLDTFTLDGT